MSYKTLLFKFLLNYFKICGILPIKIKIDNTKGKLALRQKTFSCSKFAVFYNVILMITIVITTGISSKIFYSSDLYVALKFDKIKDVIQDASLTLTSVIVLLIYCIKQKKLVIIANKFNNIIYYLNVIEIEANEIKEKVVRRVTIMLAIDVPIILVLILTFSNNNFIFVAYCTSLYICVWLIKSLFLQYTLALTVIKLIFEKLNQNLWLFSKQSYCWSGNQLLQLQKLYSLLNDLSQEISKFYSYPMFFASINMFLSLMFPAYYVVKPIFFKKNDLTISMYAHIIFYWLFCFLSLVFLSTTVSSTINEVIIILNQAYL